MPMKRGSVQRGADWGELRSGIFEHWEKTASVRVKPRRVPDALGEGMLPFPPESVPALAHPLVRARPEAEAAILLHAMYGYMYFTSVVEQLAVIPIATGIAMGRFLDGLDPPMRRDAFKICTDEAWHAQFSYDFIVDAAAANMSAPPVLVEPGFVRDVAAVRETVDTSLHGLVDMLFAVVTETSVSRLLRNIPRDDRISRAVRQVVADHAADEARHHAYFKSLLKVIWPLMSDRERRTLGVRIPTLIGAFCKPDATAAAGMLRAAGFDPGETAQIVGDCYSVPSRVDVEMVTGTLAAFAEVGAFDDVPVLEAFASSGLL
jgi:P-aminobenzoate N-oxygenase AurF